MFYWSTVSLQPSKGLGSKNRQHSLQLSQSMESVGYASSELLFSTNSHLYALTCSLSSLADIASAGGLLATTFLILYHLFITWRLSDKVTKIGQDKRWLRQTICRAKGLIFWDYCHATENLLTSETLILPSWKEQVVGSCVQRFRYLHQWQRKALLTQDRHLQGGDSNERRPYIFISLLGG